VIAVTAALSLHHYDVILSALRDLPITDCRLIQANCLVAERKFDFALPEA
jgi:hypothetical protein